MNCLSLLFLLFSAASAFSPSASPRLHRRSAASSPRCTAASHRPIPRGRAVGPSTCDAPRPLRSPFRHVDALGRDGVRAASSVLVMMKAISAEERPGYKKRIAAFMAFLTGWADSLFIAKYNFFGTMMTGNSMKMGWAIVDGRVRDGAFFLSVILSYIVGVGMFRRAELSYKDRALNVLFAPIVAGCFLCSDYLTWINASKFIPAMLLSFAWGIINSVGSEVTGTLIFVVTGAMTRFANMMVDRISRTAGRKKIPKEGCLMSLSVIWGFILGAAWSAFLSKAAPKLVTRGVFGIMGGIYALLFLWLDREQLGAWWLTEDGELCDIDAEEVDCN